MVYTKIFLKFPYKFWPSGPEKEFFIYAHERRGYYTFWQVCFFNSSLLTVQFIFPKLLLLLPVLLNHEEKRGGEGVEFPSFMETIRILIYCSSIIRMEEYGKNEYLLLCVEEGICQWWRKGIKVHTTTCAPYPRWKWPLRNILYRPYIFFYFVLSLNSNVSNSNKERQKFISKREIVHFPLWLTLPFHSWLDVTYKSIKRYVSDLYQPDVSVENT